MRKKEKYFGNIDHIKRNMRYKKKPVTSKKELAKIRKMVTLVLVEILNECEPLILGR